MSYTLCGILQLNLQEDWLEEEALLAGWSEEEALRVDRLAVGASLEDQLVEEALLEVRMLVVQTSAVRMSAVQLLEAQMLAERQSAGHQFPSTLFELRQELPHPHHA